MKKWLVLVIIFGMLGWAIFDFFTAEENNFEVTEASDEIDSNLGLEVGNAAPDFELETLGGETVRLSDFHGSHVMINFWATWCPPCRAEMPDMERFYEMKDVTILAVNLTDSESNRESVIDFVDEFGFTFPILLDQELEVADLYQIQPIPTTYLVDEHGIIQYKAFGPMNYDLMIQEYEKMK